ncbi:hypothetical protein E1B28_001189 [Marasmius oreades]|uniref:FAM192A/Fyv6 N-terminal domain-containing protein n=1 Tax=Marasmius oreades TaxID=181124 RepID=A0A9P7V2Z7_9AGAR|nr:uncharacterized protein E1B28_001189 [Marasmius oreades]KAG7099331.1 hypothetical protein E1B28_001189 [Marasmius oreades]
MEDAPIPSLSTGAIGSRFVSQDEIQTARARREEQWKAAYARLGQEPPPQQTDTSTSYDGRSLAEKLAANRQAKQEEWEEKTKLANQFRALEEDEIMFLDSVREKQEQEERQRKERDGEEVKGFKEAVAARTSASNPLPTTTAKEHPSKTGHPKKDAKKSLKGVAIKKKPAITKSSALKATTTANSERKMRLHGSDIIEEPTTKRRRISES